jgi:hypothetical protein
MDQMMTEVKAEIRMNQASADTSLKEIEEIRAEMETNIEMLTQRKGAKLRGHSRRNGWSNRDNSLPTSDGGVSRKGCGENSWSSGGPICKLSFTLWCH